LLSLMILSIVVLSDIILSVIILNVVTSLPYSTFSMTIVVQPLHPKLIRGGGDGRKGGGNFN
jgi:hypothetical protein